MSLDYDLTGISDYRDVCFVEQDGQRRLSPVTEAMVFLCMFTGVGPDLTEDNIEEFIARATTWEKVNGAYLLRREGGVTSERPVTEEEIRAHLGLHTNVFPTEPRASFIDRLFRCTFPKTAEDTTFRQEIA